MDKKIRMRALVNALFHCDHIITKADRENISKEAIAYFIWFIKSTKSYYVEESKYGPIIVDTNNPSRKLAINNKAASVFKKLRYL